MMVISGDVIEKPNKCRFFLRIPYESLSDSIILVDDLNLPKDFICVQRVINFLTSINT